MIKQLKKIPVDIYLRLKNNTPSKQPVVLFDSVGAYNTSNALVQNTQYQWDIATDLANAAIFNLDTLVLIAAPQGGNYQQYTYVNPSGKFTNIDQVVTGLNSLGIGTFFAVGPTIFKAYNFSYALSSINLTKLYIAEATTSALYSTNGSLIYPVGYTVNLITATLTQINPANPFWKNIPASLTDGPFNRNVNGNPAVAASQPIGLFAQINAPASGTYYLGFSFDELGQVYVNNELVIDLSTQALRLALANNINAILGSAYSASDILDSLWHIIPITLNAGRNVIQLVGSHLSGETGIGVEVYNNTVGEIAAATSYADLNLLYGSVSYVGQNLF